MWDAATGEKLRVRVLRGHKDGVASVSFSADSRRLASASWDKTVRVWDAATGECIEVREGHGDAATIAGGARAFPLRAVWRALETVMEDAATGEPVAWFPAALNRIATHPYGCAWAGAVANHVQIITLEGCGAG